MFDFTKLIDALKLPVKTVAGVAFAASILLFAPKSLLADFGLEDFVLSFRPYIGTIFIVAISICGVTGISAIGSFLWPWISQAFWINGANKRLRNLNPQEKKILAYYIGKQTREQNLNVMSGAVKTLELDKIIFRASSLGRMTGFSYAIQPWAWEYLNKHPELLE